MKKMLSVFFIIVLISLTACSGNRVNSGNESESDIPVEREDHSQESQIVDQTTSQGQDDNEDIEITESINIDPLDIHEENEDYDWDTGNVTTIQLADGGSSTDNPAVLLDGSLVTITMAGNYSLSGSLSDGQIIVDTEGDGIVRLILNSVNINHNSGSAIYIASADKVLIYLPEGSSNFLTDGNSYVLPDPESDEPNAALFSKADLTIDGSGSLSVAANYNDGIASKDGLLINSGNITVNAIDDGFRGKDYVVIRGATISITSGGDGIKSDEAEDSSKGYIVIESGEINIVAKADAIEAETTVTIYSGLLNLTSGGGSSAMLITETSGKGIKGLSSIVIHDGVFTINSADDCLHTNDVMTIYDGEFNLSSGDDGIHADSELTIENGQIVISQSYEGLESAVMTINGGVINITASDDGINLAGGVDGSGMNAGMQPGGRGGRGGPGQDGFSQSGNYALYINGGEIAVDADGDGIDSNGSVTMTDGTVTINGPVESMNGALDFVSFAISGGTLIAAGSSGMAQVPNTSDGQPVAIVFLNGTLQNGVEVQLNNSSGDQIFSFTPSKYIQSLVFSTPQLEVGETYSLFIGGSEYTSFEFSSLIIQIGQGGMFRR